jgi:protein ImuB
MLALWFPWLPSERILRGRMGRAWRCAAPPSRARAPLVIGRSEGNAQRVFAVDEQAAALGLRPGLALADARAMHPAAEFVEADEAADRRLLTEVADWCDRYTPLVAMCGADGLFLDISGCAHLFGGERGMIDDLLERLLRQGFRARGALASTPGMAWAAARFLDRAAVAPGHEADALLPMPLAALRLDPLVRAGLEGVGLRTVGAILNAPRAPLTRRFGPSLLMRLDQALGRVEEAVSPRLPVAPLSVERRLAEPIVATEDVERLAMLLASRLKGDLERRDEGARRLELALFRVDGAVLRLGVGASRPIREPGPIVKLFREKLAAVGDLDAQCGFELVRLSVLEASPFAQVQGDLAGDGQDGDAGLALFADRVRARLGDEALAVFMPVESHLPERAAVCVPFADRPEAGGEPPPAPLPERPVRLLANPEPVEVALAEIPEGPPRQFRWRRVLHHVARAEGPERIAPEWWHDEPDAPIRDYFRIEDGDGRRFWLFRQGLYGSAPPLPRWFLHGVFA